MSKFKELVEETLAEGKKITIEVTPSKASLAADIFSDAGFKKLGGKQTETNEWEFKDSTIAGDFIEILRDSGVTRDEIWGWGNDDLVDSLFD